jgi:hypothetical protein
MRELNKISQDLFDLIRSRFEHVSIGDESGESTDNPEDARFFNFDYVTHDGKNYGNITMTLVDDSALKILFSKKITNDLEPDEKANWYQFLKNLRGFAKRNMLRFDVRDITRNNLQVRDLKHVSQVSGAMDADDLTESRMFGNTRNSYQDIGAVKLLVRHTGHINLEEHGARTRNIDSIFVETQLGERFLLPFKRLPEARAMARHISNGGIIQDEIGQHIVETVNEMSSMRVFVRNMKHRVFEDAETSMMVEAAIERYTELRTNLVHMSGQQGYRRVQETLKTQTPTIMEDEFDLDQLKERFVKKVFDDRLSEALPHVYRAYRNRQRAMENAYIAEFDTWANDITEGQWALPDSDIRQEDLAEIMGKPLAAGSNGADAIAAIGDIIGSDTLNDELYDFASEQGPDADARIVVIDWLRENNYSELADQFEEIINPTMADPTQPNPNQLTPQANVPGPQSPTRAADEKVPTVTPPMPNESIDHMLRLAGLVKKV